jgi:hypothetical protein
VARSYLPKIAKHAAAALQPGEVATEAAGLQPQGQLVRGVLAVAIAVGGGYGLSRLFAVRSPAWVLVTVVIGWTSFLVLDALAGVIRSKARAAAAATLAGPIGFVTGTLVVTNQRLFLIRHGNAFWPGQPKAERASVSWSPSDVLGADIIGYRLMIDFVDGSSATAPVYGDRDRFVQNLRALIDASAAGVSRRG